MFTRGAYVRRERFCARTATSGGMDVNPRECMFCHDGLPVVRDEPVNLAFLAHLDRSPGCADEFNVWKGHMALDFRGD